ncbi:PLK protein kinase [Pyricularia oryzae 70-15]|uniref:PLK protein kinase n=1 Tax=Pyricularia oryzae (strain 70-15 / ATCC MYA-4617 / FGSC 8958) TaxID=242507 RepID=G4MRN5_PYRO7|nr:PLK protein kinase [Pyricularia oryzae 70-15]EHA57458.1 PLK protein kinase [Pyricularia oryzae 70-15]KAI7914478.1 PLK protein kinase [Pyricularia oryzae]KAI7928670.1 PLK protein kinase [Pyricularia oryzae]
MVAKGIDMEALSPRDANAQRPQRVNDLKTKAAAQLKANKEKEHPPPPPPHVTEPPSNDCKDGNVYQVGKLLGKGGFAVCYEGQLPGTRKRFALKIVKSKMPSKMEQKFQTELQIHSKMRQVNIVQFYRAFSFESSTYLVLELCPNGSLMDMVKRRKGVTEAEVRFYAVQIAGAIKYMHSKGIIHRDLKMGNIFLDRQMNAKIGDFGLAALLVTGRDMQTIRRTTLCGTPNYIAPEILEKGRKGHDHNVDIWSLGVIVFAMLTSKPPFQSTTTDEIYRRARERDYEWPTMESLNRIISKEAKDLVATMLEDADRRPDPDSIVQHPFFLAGYMPSSDDMTPKLREYPPDNECFYNYPRNEEEEVENLLALKEMCKSCEVGPWNEMQVVHRPVWREMAAEEKAGLTPIIPLEEGIVYRPFDEVAKEIRAQQKFAPQNSTSQARPKSEEPSQAPRNPLPDSAKPLPQSFAAQQRAQGRTAKAPGTIRLQDMREATAKQPSTVRSRAKKEADVVVSVAPVDVPPETLSSIPRSVSGQSLPAREQTLTLRGTTRSSRPQLTSSRTEPILRKASGDSDVQPAATRRSATPPAATQSNDQVSLFNPLELREKVPETRPDLVLDRLRKLQAELERALNSRSMAYVSTREKTPSPPHIVVKWVDYTNKFGLGYILSDGTIGCILRQMPTNDGAKSPMLPPACLLVHDGERHIRRKNDLSYPDRHQILPMGESIYFYENYGEDGLSRVRVDPRNFKVPVGPDGVAAKLSAGKDVFDHRKRERIVLWKKFANYMLAYGRELEGEGDEAPIPIPKMTDLTAAPSDLVTFYQRFGDVGCWHFSDGHVQFNFPDHTKIVLDSTGTWCHFWHLPEDAANNLATEGTLDESSLDARSVLSYPLQTLLNFTVPSKATSRTANASRCRPEIPAELQSIPSANDFRRKIDFIKNVVKEWVVNGGIGNSDMSRDRRIRWAGYRETKTTQGPLKHVWVTIGSRRGDERYTTMWDPRKPNEFGPDIDDTKKP